MPPPIPRCSSGASSSLNSPSHFSLPRYGSRVGLHIVLFEACSAFPRVAACTLALSPIRDTLIEGLSHFVTSMTAPIASGWSGCRVGLAPTGKAPPSHGARQNRTVLLGAARPAIAQTTSSNPSKGGCTMPTITTKDGTEIFYKDWGTGQPIVLSHGWPLSAGDWDPQMLFFLSKGFRVIAHDRRGHGPSTQTSDGHDMDHYA